jgi:hypothetical protein
MPCPDRCTADGARESAPRAGLIAKWGRGTNRFAEKCRAAGIAPPEFAKIAGAAVVTFRVPVAQAGVAQPELRPESDGLPLEARIVARLGSGPLAKSELVRALGQTGVSGQLKKAVASLLEHGALEYTVPDKPKSRLQVH